MEEKQKVQVVFEFDRSEYDAYLFLMNQKKTEEVEQVWNAMSVSLWLRILICLRRTVSL